MPCFLNVIVGSNSVAAASSLKPGPESCTSIVTCSPPPRVCTRTVAARPGRLGGILQQVGQDPLHQVGAGVHTGTAVVEPKMVRHSRDAPAAAARRARSTSALTSRSSGWTGGSLAKSENARTRRSSESISLTTIWTA